MGKCLFCRNESPLISENLECCLNCIRKNFNKVKSHLLEVHKESRRKFNLPETIPKDPKGHRCNICVNKCAVEDKGLGYCGLPLDRRYLGNVEWYYDNLPTNCVADWVCAGGTGCSYPKFSYRDGPEIGYKNLAVFYNGCTFNCLFCQNWHYRKNLGKGGTVKAEELASYADDRTSCICYFGGDPTPQLPHAITTSKIALRNNKGRILRICWETNGSMNKRFLDEMLELSLASGGCIKFDLKTFMEELNIALCGITNRQTKENFTHAAKWMKKRKEPPLVIASTLLIPGYIDEEEIKEIATFIASLDKNIPYSLLGFYPHFFMDDLPRTSKTYAQACLEVALKTGLKRVRIANVHLLSDSY